MHSAALRDRSQTTRTLLLAHLRQQPGASLTDVAASLGVTVQAMSTHARVLAGEALLEKRGSRYHLTPRGQQALQEGVRSLEAAVGSLARDIADVPATSALATKVIRAGQRVVLRMEQGDLVAEPGNGSSTGIAVAGGAAGDEVIVGQLAGLVDLSPGTLDIISLPGPLEGGCGHLRQDNSPAPRFSKRIAAHGTGARILAQRLHGPAAVAFQFAAPRAAFNAAERGLSVTLYVTRDLLPRVLDDLAGWNAENLARVPLTIREASGP